MRTLRHASLAAAATALLALALATPVFAQTPAVRVSSTSAPVGSSGTVQLQALDITGAQELGAWTIDVAYDPALLAVVDCTAAQGGVCNPAFAADTVRVTGANAGGLSGDIALGSIAFQCLDEATAPLHVVIATFSDATVGDPQPIAADVIDGAVRCSAAAPPEPPPTAVPSGCVNDALENNNDLADPTNVTLPYENGSLRVCPNDIDIFAFELAAGADVTIEVTYDSGVGVVGLAAFDPDVAVVDVSESGSGAERVAFRAEAAGTHYAITVMTAGPSQGVPYAIAISSDAPAVQPAGQTSGGGAAPVSDVQRAVKAPSAGTGPVPLDLRPADWAIAGLAGAGIAWVLAGAAVLRTARFREPSLRPRAAVAQEPPADPHTPFDAPRNASARPAGPPRIPAALPPPDAVRPPRFTNKRER